MIKLKKILVFNLLLATAALFFSACGGSTTTTNAATNKTAENKAATNTATENKSASSPTANTATENKAVENKSTASTGGDEIGVPECDEYIKKYEACVMSKVPETQRALYKPTLEQMRSSWKQAASNPQTKAALASGCKTATETAKQSLSAFSCEW